MKTIFLQTVATTVPTEYIASSPFCWSSLLSPLHPKYWVQVEGPHSPAPLVPPEFSPLKWQTRHCSRSKATHPIQKNLQEQDFPDLGNASCLHSSKLNHQLHSLTPPNPQGLQAKEFLLNKDSLGSYDWIPIQIKAFKIWQESNHHCHFLPKKARIRSSQDLKDNNMTLLLHILSPTQNMILAIPWWWEL